jgi:hypothetical protein
MRQALKSIHEASDRTYRLQEATEQVPQGWTKIAPECSLGSQAQKDPALGTTDTLISVSSFICVSYENSLACLRNGAWKGVIAEAHRYV